MNSGVPFFSTIASDPNSRYGPMAERYLALGETYEIRGDHLCLTKKVHRTALHYLSYFALIPPALAFGYKCFYRARIGRLQLDFEADLNVWVNKSTRQWDEHREAAAHSIRMAYLNQSNCLDLFHSGLTTLPDAIGNLRKLRRLHLKLNHLKTLPDEIGNLRKLRQLDLSVNELRILPNAIGNLRKLKKLNLIHNKLRTLPDATWCLASLIQLVLSYNKLRILPDAIGELIRLNTLELTNNRLTVLPDAIGNLSSLKHLILSHNQITQLPNTIGNLRNLETLDLLGNKLSSLPASMGRLFALRQLNLESNPALNTLPLSLGNCSLLTRINTERTSIPEDQSRSLEAQWSAKRVNLGKEVFIAKITAWQNLAEVSFSLPQEENLSKVYEWLHRLERTKDYTTNHQKELARIAMELLQAACENPDFSPLFYTQIVANAGNCEDRAAMALNELYTAWKMHCSGDFKDMAAALKTDALRKELARKIQGLESQEESVEIFLYYELAISRFYRQKHPQEIAPLTLIRTMVYKEIGRRGFDLNELYRHIEEHYLDGILDYPVFEAILDKDEEFRERFSKIELPEESMEVFKTAKLSLAKEIVQKRIKG